MIWLWRQSIKLDDNIKVILVGHSIGKMIEVMVGSMGNISMILVGIVGNIRIDIESRWIIFAECYLILWSHDGA